MSGTREPVRSKADEDGAQAATNAPVKEASVVFVSVRLPPLTLPLSLELESQRSSQALQGCRGKTIFFAFDESTVYGTSPAPPGVLLIES